MSYLGYFYTRIYRFICGCHPRTLPWHFQWLVAKDLYPHLRQVLPTIQGRILDVGCGDKPYRCWATRATEYVGLDVCPGPAVDIVVVPGSPWPVDSSSFDAVICTQVLQYVADLGTTFDETYRVLKPGGQLILTVPFAYNEHSVRRDYWRWSVDGIRHTFSPRYEISRLRPLGGVGSTLGVLMLNWIEVQANRHKFTRFLKGLLLPVWILFSGIANLLGWLLDKVDGTHVFYNNVFLLARKRCE